MELKNIDNTDWKDQLTEQFINPLQKLGFEFQNYDHTWHNKTCTGVHILTLEHDGNSPCTRRQIKDLMIDDDSQPFSNYTYYFGTLWIYIPYSG